MPQPSSIYPPRALNDATLDAEIEALAVELDAGADRFEQLIEERERRCRTRFVFSPDLHAASAYVADRDACGVPIIGLPEGAAWPEDALA